MVRVRSVLTCPYHHDGRATRDGVVVGYAALPEHAFDAGLLALGDLLAEA